MDRWSSRRLSEDMAQLNTMKTFNQTFMRYPRQSQPQVHQNVVFSQLQTVRRRHESFKDNHLCKQRDLTGSSWNSTHLDGFLHSRGSGSLPNRPKKEKSKFNRENSPEHFFRTTTENKNASHIGFTNINPLAANPRVQPHRLDRFCSEILNKDRFGTTQLNDKQPQTARFRYQANSVKYRDTNPWTSRQQPPEQHLQAKKARLLNLIEKRYPHGILGLDNPDQAIKFYRRIEPKQLAVREHPISRQSFEIDKSWKTKRRIQEYRPEHIKRDMVCVRRLKNAPGCDYNIVSNTEA